MTLLEIAASLGRSRSAPGAVLASATEKLREELRRRGLTAKDLLP